MSYNFKEDLASRLPEGYKIYQIYSIDENTSKVEGIRDNIKTFFELPKIDLGQYLLKTPTISLPGPCTLNDVYNKISEIYSLGLVVNVDYYDNTPLNPSSNHQYVELPISSNSYGYKGLIRCYVILSPLAGMNPSMERDVSSFDSSKLINKLKFRNFLMGSLIKVNEVKFIENTISLEFVSAIIDAFKEQVDEETLSEYRSLLSSSRVMDLYSDGLSDIAVISMSQELFQIRYSGLLKNNDKSDTTSDNSQGLTDGDTEGSAENPVSGEGDLNTGEQSEHPYSSTEGNNTEVEIEIE